PAAETHRCPPWRQRSRRSLVAKPLADRSGNRRTPHPGSRPGRTAGSRPEAGPDRDAGDREGRADRSAHESIGPSWRAVLDPRGPFLIPLILVVVSRVFMLLTTPAPSEDAFITFRYARDLASGQGLVYNPGEHVMGFRPAPGRKP